MNTNCLFKINAVYNDTKEQQWLWAAIFGGSTRDLSVGLETTVPLFIEEQPGQTSPSILASLASLAATCLLIGGAKTAQLE